MRRDELEALERRASAGDMDSQYLAGCARHEDDNESLRDMNRALRWLRLASRQGDARADRRLGYIHVVELRDLFEGLSHYLKGAQRGDGLSAQSAGHLLATPQYLREHHDPLRALPLFEQAAAAGAPRATVPLGLLLLRRGFERADPHRGARLVEQASAEDFVQALLELTDEVDAGRLVPLRYVTWAPDGTPDFPFLIACEDAAARAVDFGRLREAAAGDDQPDSQFAFACLSLSHPAFKNDRQAVRALARAAHAGHVDAHRALAWLGTNRRLSVLPRAA